MDKRVSDGPRSDLRNLRCTNVPRERRRELRSLTSSQLLALIQLAKDDLTLGELYYIHDLAVRRLDKGDTIADQLLAEMRSLMK